MIYVLDACTFINLANSGSFANAIALPGCSFLLSKSVKRESVTVAKALEEAIAAGYLQEIDDTVLPAFEFASLKVEFDLGDGETECLQAAKVFGCCIACDDRAARIAAIRMLGESRVTGSIGLLKQCVHARLLTPEAAYAAYQLMKAHGGFLPLLGLHHFKLTERSY